jgi:EgtB-related family protein
VPHDARWALPMPGLEDTLAWMASTQADTLGRLAALPEDAGDDDLYFFRLVTLHEAMHVEAAVYMAPQLGIALPTAPASALPPVQALRVPAQAWTAGWSGQGFAFDNELPPMKVELGAFEIDSQPVSWSRFAGFVEAGGYHSPRWWSEQGWAWRRQAKPAQPLFPAGEGAAVHLCLHEAEAFEPHPGFVAHPYADYSQPWFGSRRVLKGASPATPQVLAHPRFRNFFTPERTDILAGFRSCA